MLWTHFSMLFLMKLLFGFCCQNFWITPASWKLPKKYGNTVIGTMLLHNPCILFFQGIEAMLPCNACILFFQGIGATLLLNACVFFCQGIGGKLLCNACVLFGYELFQGILATLLRNACILFGIHYMWLISLSIPPDNSLHSVPRYQQLTFPC